MAAMVPHTIAFRQHRGRCRRRRCGRRRFARCDAVGPSLPPPPARSCLGRRRGAAASCPGPPTRHTQALPRLDPDPRRPPARLARAAGLHMRRRRRPVQGSENGVRTSLVKFQNRGKGEEEGGGAKGEEDLASKAGGLQGLLALRLASLP